MLSGWWVVVVDRDRPTGGSPRQTKRFFFPAAGPNFENHVVASANVLELMFNNVVVVVVRRF